MGRRSTNDSACPPRSGWPRPFSIRAERPAPSRASALGFCQFLSRNWEHLNRLTPVVIEAYNQTTQAPYCAAYLSILATMYDSFIPALSEHHAGGVNVGRTVINGERLGGVNTREQYFKGSEFAADLRVVRLQRYRDLYRTYGARSSLYAEMVFGNMVNVGRLPAERRSHGSSRCARLGRFARSISPPDQALGRRSEAIQSGARCTCAAQANLYLPFYVPALGGTCRSGIVRRPLGLRRRALRLRAPRGRRRAVARREVRAGTPAVPGRFSHRHRGRVVMATTLAYVIGDLRTSRRAAILEEFRTSAHIMDLFKQGVEELGRQ